MNVATLITNANAVAQALLERVAQGADGMPTISDNDMRDVLEKCRANGSLPEIKWVATKGGGFVDNSDSDAVMSLARAIVRDQCADLLI
jgi:hypothetical protein